ncbi:hypothetical protein [Virgibacillus ndiopensis]|uniref:hypothetical protein n=1 Tax=Virgibacillus ndiopensis TaxID=2004408 RepID=UPI000C08323F|nr:hypothetical protein [Virgibacillus ndiopensis]
MQENVVAKILFIIGIAEMVVGLLIGIILANAGYYNGFVWSTFLAWTIGGSVTGMLFIGFSEVIKLLHMINRKINAREATVGNNTANYLDIFDGAKRTTKPVNWKLGEQDKEKIYDLYKQEKIIEIVPSILEGYCLVKLENEQGQFVRVVDVGGFGAEEVHDNEEKRKVISWYNRKDD